MDIIRIEQLEIFAYHGCNEEEKRDGQKFYVDLNYGKIKTYTTLYTDVMTPGLSDDLEDTVNYAKACKFINKFLTENRFDLIEAVAEQTTRALLKEFPKIRKVDFTINKPNGPIKLPFGNVAVSVSREWHKAYLSIGSNIGDKEGYLNQAVDMLYDDENCKVGAISKFIQTKPYGPVEQDDFLNGCVEIETLYSPQELLKAVNAIEAAANRTREIHWGPRTLDVDIVLYDDEIVADSNLFIPHREMHKREFVLEPLVQIAPYAINPISKKTAEQLLDELREQSGNVNPGCSGCQGCAMRK